MDPEITHTSLMEQVISFLHTNGEGGVAEQTQIKSAGNQPIQEDSLLSLDTRISEIEEIFAEGPIPAPESFMTVEFARTSHSSFCDMPKNSLTPDQLCSLNVPPVQADDYGQLETIYPQYPVQLQSEFLSGLKQNDLAPASQAALAQNTVLSSSEVTERTAEDEKPFHGQNVFFQMQSGLHKEKPTSVEIPPLPSISIQSSALGGSQRAFIEEQELASFSDFPQHQPQASCSTHNPHIQPFHLDPLLGYRPQTYLPSFNYLSTGPRLHVSQTSDMPYPNSILFNPLHLTPMPTVHANLKQTDHHLIHGCQLQCLHQRHIFQNPFTPDMRFNCPPLSGRQLKPNVQQIPQNQYESFRLWQEYCNVAKHVYTSSPDLEALACYFVHVLHFLCVHCPALPSPESLRKAMLQWRKLSSFDRMQYYDMAQTFMEFEKKELEGIRPKPRMEFSVQSSKQSGNVPVQVINSNVQDLAEKALWEYSEIMKDLEANIKEGSEIAKETEEVDDLDEEQFTEYLNQLCSQKSVTEVEAEIDMAFVSSLLSSDSNTTDMLMELGVVDNAQDVPTAITVEPVPFYSSNETTAECFSASAPKLHPPPETCDTQSLPPLQPGLYMTGGTNLPPYDSHFLQRDSKGPNLLDVQNAVPLVPSYTQETAKENSSSKKDMTEVRPANRHKNDTFFAPACSSARPSITDPLTVFQNVSQSTLNCIDFNIQQKETQITYKKDNNLIVVPTNDYSVGEMFVSSTDCSAGETLNPTTVCSFGEMVAPTIDYSVGEKFVSSIDYSVVETADPTTDWDVRELVVSSTDCSVGEIVVPSIDCSVGETLNPKTGCSFGKMVVPTTDYSIVETVDPTTDWDVRELVVSLTDCGVGETVDPTTDCSVGEMVAPTTDCSVGETVDPTADCSVGEMVNLTTDWVVRELGCEFDKMVTPATQCGVRELVPPTTDYGETGELFNMPGPKGEDAGSSMHGNNPQYFHVPRSQSYTDTTLLVPQDDVAIVTQKVHDPVINDQINESSNPKIKAYKMQEEPITQQLCVNGHNVLTDSTVAPLDQLGLQSFMADLVDLSIPSELLTLGQDSSDDLYQMLLLSLGEAEAELPRQDIDKGNVTNSPPENSLASSIEKGMKKEVRRTDTEAIKETNEHENMVNDHVYNDSRENETERVQSIMIQQTHAGSPVANEKVAVEIGQNATEGSQDDSSLYTCEGDLGQDPNIEAGQHNQLQTDGKKVIKVSESCTNPTILTGRRNLGTPLDQENKKLLLGKKEKDHRHESKQNLKKVGIEVGQQIKDQRNEKRTSRSSTAVKVRDAFDEDKKTRINKEKRLTQTQRKSERLSKQVPKNDAKTSAFVMNTRMTRREFISLTSEDLDGTQNVKKTENSNSEMDGNTEQPPAEGKKNNASEIKSRSKSDVMTGRRKKIGTAYVKEKVLDSSKAGGESVQISTRSCNGTPGNSVAVPEKQMGDRKEEPGTMKCSKTTKTRNLRIKECVISSSLATHLSNEKRTRECGPVAAEAAEKCVKTKEVELKSNTPKTYDSSKSNGSGLAYALTTDKVKERIEKERQSKKASKDEQCVGGITAAPGGKQGE